MLKGICRKYANPHRKQTLGLRFRDAIACCNKDKLTATFAFQVEIRHFSSFLYRQPVVEISVICLVG